MLYTSNYKTLLHCHVDPSKTVQIPELPERPHIALVWGARLCDCAALSRGSARTRHLRLLRERRQLPAGEGGRTQPELWGSFISSVMTNKRKVLLQNSTSK